MLERKQGKGNLNCKDKIYKKFKEHQWRKRLTSIYLTLSDERIRSEQD